jgi:hypothetical protein
VQRFWSSILLSMLCCSVTTPERVLRRSALCAGRPVFVLARHRHREHHRRACSAEGPDQQCVAWTRNPDQKRNSAHQKPGSRGTRRLAAHQRTLRMTRAQHRLRSPTAAERGWLRTRLTLRTLPLCSRSIRAQSTAPHRRSCTINAGAPWPACAALEAEDVARARRPAWKRISIAKRSPCRFFHSHSESFVAV